MLLDKCSCITGISSHLGIAASEDVFAVHERSVTIGDDRSANRHTGKYTDRQTDRDTDRQASTCTQADRQADRQTGKYIGRG